ncbi:MAG TPA: 50S ribosomal protein L13 [Polyangiaceae bacterium]|nr:50S ribosomal protein L13 [Polyangiaceae bacterium]
MRTFTATPTDADANRKWWVIDAQNQPLGRVASRVANLLRGKHKTIFTPHIDTGDFVIVVNAAQIKVTGAKANEKLYYRHSGYPGGMTTRTYSELLAHKADAPLTLAVRGMLPKNVLGRQMIKKLKVYSTDQHPHKAQQPQAFTW